MRIPSKNTVGLGGIHKDLIQIKITILKHTIHQKHFQKTTKIAEPDSRQRDAKKKKRKEKTGKKKNQLSERNP